MALTVDTSAPRGGQEGQGGHGGGQWGPGDQGGQQDWQEQWEWHEQQRQERRNEGSRLHPVGNPLRYAQSNNPVGNPLGNYGDHHISTVGRGGGKARSMTGGSPSYNGYVSEWREKQRDDDEREKERED